MTNDERLMFAEIAELRSKLEIAERDLKEVRELADNHPNDAGVMIARLRAIWNVASSALDAIQKKGGA